MHFQLNVQEIFIFGISCVIVCIKGFMSLGLDYMIRGGMCMSNVHDYIYWRGDLSFEQDPLNEIDALIFSEFAYIDFSKVASKQLKRGDLTIKKAAELWDEANPSDFMPSGYLHHAKAYEILTLAGDSERFQDLVIASDVKELSLEDESQFGVTTFHRDGQPFFVAFEGTDLRSLSWKEDLQMTYLTAIPSQSKAVEFLNHHFENYPNPVSIGGHSKGSNLAIYAAIFMREEFQHLVEKIYSYDGPGFTKNVLQTKTYKQIADRIASFTPQDGIIGLMLHKLEEQIVVYSNASELMQHDVYSWEIKGNQFVPSQLSEEALKIKVAINELLDELSLSERELFSDALFTIIGDGADDFIAGNRNYTLQKIPEMIKEYRDLQSESKKILLKVLKLFYRKRLEILREN